MQFVCMLVVTFAMGALGDPAHHEEEISNLQLLVPMRYLNTDPPAPLPLPPGGPFSDIPSDAFTLDSAFLPVDDRKTVKKDLSHPTPTTSSKSHDSFQGYLYQRCLEYLVNQEVGRKIANDSNMLVELCAHYLSTKAEKKPRVQAFEDSPVDGLTVNSGELTFPSIYGDSEAAGLRPASESARLTTQGNALSNNDFTTYVLNALDLGIGNSASNGQGGMSGNFGVKGQGKGVGNAAFGGKGGQVGNLGVGGTGGLFGNLGIGGQGGFFGNVGVGSGHQHVDLYSNYPGNLLSPHYPARTSNHLNTRETLGESKAFSDAYDKRSREFQKRLEELFRFAGDGNGEGTVASGYSLDFMQLGGASVGSNAGVDVPVSPAREAQRLPLVGSLAAGGRGGQVGSLAVSALCGGCGSGSFALLPVRGHAGERRPRPARPSQPMPSKRPLQQEQPEPEHLSMFRPMGGRGSLGGRGGLSGLAEFGGRSGLGGLGGLGGLDRLDGYLFPEPLARGDVGQGPPPTLQSQSHFENSPQQEQPELDPQPGKFRPVGGRGGGRVFQLRRRPELRRTHTQTQNTQPPPSYKLLHKEQPEPDLLGKFRPMGGRRGWMVLGNADTRLKQYINSKKPWLIV